MTDVGKISLGVEIDASDLSAKLGEAVRRAIAPALAQVQKQLNDTQREYNETGRTATKSSAVQAEGAREVARQVAQIGNEQTKTAAKTQAAGAVTTRQINAITRAYERQTAAILANTGARAGNAAAPTGGPPGTGGGSPGGGGGGPPGGVHAGGFMRGGKGRFGFFTSPVGLNLGALGIGSLPSAATAITQVVGGIQQLGQAGLALPGIYGAVAVSAGTAVIGFKGMGDAVKALSEAMKTGDPKDLEKATEALKDMDPAAVAVAKTVAGLTRGPLLDLQKMTAGRMLNGFDRDLQGLADKALPRVSGGMGKVADSWNGTLKTLTGSLGSDRNLSVMDRIFGNTAEGQARANAAIDPLVHGVGTLVKAGTDVLPRLGDGLAAGARRFDEWITKVDSDGRLNKWINDGITGVRQLAESGLNVVKVITDITRAAGADGGSFLEWLERSTGKLRELTSSAEGQEKMANFFREANEQAKQWLPILQNLAEVLKIVYDASVAWSGVLLPFLRGATELMTAMPGLSSAVLVGFLAFRTIAPFTALISQLDKVNGGLDGIGKKSGGLGGKLNGALMGGAIAGGGAMSIFSTDGPNPFGDLATLGGATLAGAQLAGPWGAAVGALIGGATVLTDAFLDQSRRIDEINRRRDEDLANRPPAVPAIRPGEAIQPGPAVAPPPGLTTPGPLPGPPTLKGLLLGPEAVSTGNPIGDIRNLGAIDAALGAVGNKANAARSNIELLANGIQTLPTGEVVLKDNTPEAIKRVQDLGYAVTKLPDGQIQIAVQYMHNGQPISLDQLKAPIRVPAVPGDTYRGPGRSSGGVLPGFSLHDNMLVPLAGGEGIIIPEAMRALGGDWLHSLNSQFRGGISRQGYADGGVHLGTGRLPGPTEDDPMVTLLEDIRALLQGRGPANAPLNMTATGMSQLTDQLVGNMPGMEPGRMGPFGTPIKPRNRGYEMAAAAIQALGGDPEKFIGPDPVEYFGKAAQEQIQQYQQSIQSTTSSTTGTTGLPGVAVDPAKYADALARFAASGNLADLTGLGLDANDSVVKAIVSAREKKKGGLEDKAIADLVGQVLTGGGYAGVLDSSNQALVTALQSFREKMAKGKIGAVPGMPGGAAGANWQALAQFESSGNPAINTGNGFSGAFQFTPETWRANKPPGAPDNAWQATYEQQVAAAENVLKSQGPGAWPAASAAHPEWFKPSSGGGVPSAMSSGWFPGGGGRVQGSKKGLQPAAANLFDVIAAQFPQITEIGGVRADALPYHPSGRALDIMIPGAGGLNDPTPPEGKALGDSIYNFLMSNASQLGIDTSGTLWQQEDHFNHIHAQLLDGVQQFTNAGLNAPGMTGDLGLGGSAATGGVTPVYVVNMPGAGGAGMPPGVDALLGGVTSGAQEAAGNVVGDIFGAIPATPFGPTAEGQRKPNAALQALVDEGNPMALAAALGLNVEDFSRFGGAGAQGVQRNTGYDASGRLFSDTGALMDRTMTSLNAQLQAMRDQLVDVIEQTNQKLQEDALEPVVKAGVQSALEGLKESVSNQIGTAMGNAAAPPIADAVSASVAQLPIDNSGAGGGNLADPSQLAGALFASGGPVTGGTAGKDSVPALLMPKEWVLNTEDVKRMGGPEGVARFIGALRGGSGLRRFAAGGGVNVNDVVGAEFFGVGEVPIISTIINMLVRVLLKIIGVEIEARDTMLQMSSDFRQFRGDAFKAFDAQGRLLSDTSALLDRSSTSEEAAAAERIRILKIVIQAIIKYIIEKVIVPIAKAVANSLIQAGASAAGAAVNTQAPGAGGIVSALISSAGQAGVEIAAEVGTDFALAISETLVNTVADGLMSTFPDIMATALGGGLFAMFTDPAGGLLATLLGGMMGILTGAVLFPSLGGAATMIPGMSFDSGGLAEGQGYLPKATMDDELVLSPVETDLFSRFVSALESGGFGRGGNTTRVHAPITIVGGTRETAEQVEDRLLKLMP